MSCAMSPLCPQPPVGRSGTWGVGLLHVPGVGKNFGGELGEQAGEIVVLFTIGPGRKFEHALAAGPQLLDITRR